MGAFPTCAPQNLGPNHRAPSASSPENSFARVDLSCEADPEEGAANQAGSLHLAGVEKDLR